MKKLFLIIILGITMMSSTCTGDRDGCRRNIIIINNSDKTIRLYASFSYPDSISNFGREFGLTAIKPHSDYYDYSPDCREAMMPSLNKDGVLMYFLIDEAVLKSTPMDSIIKNRMYLRQYNLTFDSLEKDNWKVTYP